MTEVIEKNLANPDLQVELLSKEMGYSSRQFYRKLKPLTDKSPADIIKEYRLSTAERLLVSSNFTIEELMDRTGFTNRSTFYKAFHNVTECRPVNTANGKEEREGRTGNH